MTTVNLKAAKLDESNKMGKSRIKLWTELKKLIGPISFKEKAFKKIISSHVEGEVKSHLKLHLLYFPASTLIVTPSDIDFVGVFPLPLQYINIH